jgi:hypothetical protein
LPDPALYTACVQWCGAETICFRSGSDFQKVSALSPAPAKALPVITDFVLKGGFFMLFVMKEYRPNSHARSYSIQIFIFIYNN